MDNLNKRVGQYWTNRSKMDSNGLVLLDETINNLVANQNWDPLSRFVSRSAALNAQDRSKVMAVIRAAFGDQIIYKKDTDHPTGGRITMKDKRPFAELKLLNSYGVVKQAIEKNKGFRDADMHKELKAVAPVRERKEVDVEKAAKHLVDYMKKANVPTGLVLAEVQKMLAAAKATAVVA
jgi:hypothetical protein